MITVEDLEKIYVKPGVSARKATTGEFKVWLKALILSVYEVEVEENAEEADSLEARVDIINQLIENGFNIQIVED